MATYKESGKMIGTCPKCNNRVEGKTYIISNGVSMPRIKLQEY